MLLFLLLLGNTVSAAIDGKVSIASEYTSYSNSHDYNVNCF